MARRWMPYGLLLRPTLSVIMKILIVEDNRIATMVTRRFLHDLGFDDIIDRDEQAFLVEGRCHERLEMHHIRSVPGGKRGDELL